MYTLENKNASLPTYFGCLLRKHKYAAGLSRKPHPRLFQTVDHLMQRHQAKQIQNQKKNTHQIQF